MDISSCFPLHTQAVFSFPHILSCLRQHGFVSRIEASALFSRERQEQ